MKSLTYALCAALLCCSAHAQEQTEETLPETTDDFSVISGIGGHSCASAPVFRQQYAGFEYVVGEWLAGYMTARGTIWRIAEEREPLNLRINGLEPPLLANQLFLRCEEEEDDTLISVVAEKIFAGIVSENGQRYLGLARQ